MIDIKHPVLDKINGLSDLKSLSISELKGLAQEIRELIIPKVNTTGGHMGPNLGIVETTIALHYVFNSPVDKFVFDVSHQCYTHKILTGRKDGFTNSENYLKYTGYTAPEESEHDMFKVGHTSTSVSLAVGLAKARDLKGDNENIIALIGDGSLSGGQAYEGLNNAAILGSNLIIVVNDNEMSIAENAGGLYSNLELLRKTNGQADCNFFKSLGFDYLYLDDGNDIEKLISIFTQVKDSTKPIVLHLHTEKGKGLSYAENCKERFHFMLAGEVDRAKNNEQPSNIETYASITADYIEKKYNQDNTVVAITPATPAVTGFTQEFRKNAGKHFMDVGIAEEHAIAMISGIAKNGGKPILGVMSSFVQRTYDQLSQDLALNSNPATILVFWGGISGADATHLCTFDISMISNIPNMVYLSPTTKEEYLAMLEWSVEQTQHPVAIRVPFGDVISTGIVDNTDYSSLNKFELVEEGSKIAILGLGNLFHHAKKIKKYIKEQLGIEATLINPKFITGVDESLLNSLKNTHDVVITLEDGILNGGFGEKIARFYGNSDVKVLNYGAKKEFTDRVSIEELYKRYRLTPELILDDLKACI